MSSINNVYTTYKKVGDTMEIKIQKWGNSDGKRIPKEYLKLLDLKTNDLVNIKLEEDKTVIVKSKEKTLNIRRKNSGLLWTKFM